MKTKKLKTGVVITYDKNGNIKTLESPYCISERFKKTTKKLKWK